MSALNDRMMAYATHPQAEKALFGAAAAEAAGAPLAPEKLLMPMALLAPEQAFRYAVVAMLGSVAGGIVGYIGGYLLLVMIGRGLAASQGLQDWLLWAQSLYAGYDVMVVLAAGISPIPFKVVSLLSGFMQADLAQFVMAAVVARSARFGLVAWLLWRSGPRMKEWIERNLYGLTMTVAVGVMLVFMGLKYLLTQGSL